jgi:hypothetical protein
MVLISVHFLKNVNKLHTKKRAKEGAKMVTLSACSVAATENNNFKCVIHKQSGSKVCDHLVHRF